MNKTKRYRLSQEMYKIIQNANGGLFLLYTRHNPGDVLSLLLDGNDIGLMCRVESRHDQYYKYCKVITEGEQWAVTESDNKNCSRGGSITPVPGWRRWAIRLRRSTPQPYNLLSGVPRLHYTRIPVGLPGAPLPMDGELRTY